MRVFCIFVMLSTFCSSCLWKAFPEEKYLVDQRVRDLIDCYKIGDTMIFKSSTNIIDSFVVTSIDSTLNNEKGFFINARNFKSITVHYKQVSIDKWLKHSIEMDSKKDEKKELVEDGTLISIEKFPDTESADYYFNFKEFGCSKNNVPKFETDTISFDKIKISNYYKIDNCAHNSTKTSGLKVCYSQIRKGLIAFQTKDGVFWTRQN